MAKLVNKKESEFRKSYQTYFKMMEKGGKPVLKKAKTQAEWRKSSPATRKAEIEKARGLYG